jgi:splicing factor 3B subunit 5
LDHLQQRFIGTGHADLTRWEWAVHQHRDSYCSYVSHEGLLDFFAIAQGQTRQRVRYEMLKKMIKPVGNQPPPPGAQLINAQGEGEGGRGGTAGG